MAVNKNNKLKTILNKNSITFAVIGLLIQPFCFATSYDDQLIEPTKKQLDDHASNKQAEPISFLPIPTFITEPAVGPGLGVVGLFFHSNDKKPKKPAKVGSTLPQSISIVGALATKNGTKGGAVGHVTFWDEDRIRYQGILGYASVNLDFYNLSEIDVITPITLNIEGPALLQNVKVRYDDSNFFFGAKQMYRHVELSLADNPFNRLPLPDGFVINHLDLEINTSGLGAIMEYDSRDNPLDPELGIDYTAEYMVYDKALGSDIDYSSLKIKALNYWALTDKSNLAFRIQYDSVNNKEEKPLPVYIPPSIHLRGVSASRYQGLNVIVSELEASYKITEKIKLNAFTGLGWAADHFSDLSSSKTINTYGAGFRYLVDKHYGIWLGLDVAKGPEESAIYIQAGSTW